MKRAFRLGLLALSLALSACSSGPEKPKPADLTSDPGVLSPRLAWSVTLPRAEAPQPLGFHGAIVYAAGGEGQLVAIDTRAGRELWRASAGAALASGVGGDGRRAAVVTRGGELVTFDAGRELWRQRLSVQSYTTPLVAGDRVFVLSSDRTVIAWDAATGHRLWTQSRPGEPLVLRQAGVLVAAGDAVLAGFSGRLVALHPSTGAVRWDSAITVPRGVNDIEKLVDLVGRPWRDGDTVCVRAFQAAVGCVNVTRGTLAWSRPANGRDGLGGDAAQVTGTESDGRVVAWRRVDGERAWVNDRLRFREVTGPVSLGRALAVGDGFGYVHFLASDGGGLIGRVSTDGSAIVSAPLLAGETLVVATRNGNVFGFVPQ